MHLLFRTLIGGTAHVVALLAGVLVAGAIAGVTALLDWLRDTHKRHDNHPVLLTLLGLYVTAMTLAIFMAKSLEGALAATGAYVLSVILADVLLSARNAMSHGGVGLDELVTNTWSDEL